MNKVQNLLSMGLDIETKDYNRRTPLHIAASEGNVEIIRMLVYKGANVNAADVVCGCLLCCVFGDGL